MLLEQAAIVTDPEDPLGVVIGRERWRGAAPRAARLAVQAGTGTVMPSGTPCPRVSQPGEG